MEVALVIEIDGVFYRMSMDEAQELYDKLHVLFGDKNPVYIPYENPRKYPWDEYPSTTPYPGPYWVSQVTSRLDI